MPQDQKLPSDEAKLGVDSDLLDAFWHHANVYLSNEERSEASPREQFINAALKVLGGTDPEKFYVAKATSSGYRNQIWQGLALSRANDVLILIDKSGNESGIADAARLRLSPHPENGFDAIVICERDGSGWKPFEIIEYEHVRIAEKLQAELGDVVAVRIPDPGSAAAVPTPNHFGYSDEMQPKEVASHLHEAKNLILGGPPGTGKTHSALKVAELLCAGDAELCRLESVLKGRPWQSVPVEELQAAPLIWEIVQLHPSYTYEDFVRGMRTDPNSKGFSLVSSDGILPVMAHVAAARGKKDTLLIIDEINRCNVGAVFGETIFAIDPAQRGRAIRMQYEGATKSDDTLRVPPNLLFLCTLNTADRSIASIDFAIRRRFRYLQLRPSEAALASYYGDQKLRTTAASTILRAINSLIADSELHIGHSYLMTRGEKDEEWRVGMARKIVFEVLPLLREYADEGRVDASKPLMIGDIAVDLSDANPTSLDAIIAALAAMVPNG